MGVRTHVEGDVLIVDFGDEYLVAGTCVNCGFRRSRFAAIKTVKPEEEKLLSNPINYYDVLVRRNLIPPNTPLMLTSVDVRGYVKVDSRDPPLHVIATIGFEPPACLELEKIYDAFKPSTINIIVATPIEMRSEALLDLLRVVSEAKAIACSGILLRCKSRALGTMTDSILVAAKESKRGLLWSGVATRVGNKAARLVFNVIVDYWRSLGKDYKLKHIIGLSIDELLELIINAYSLAPVPGVEVDYVKKLAMRELEDLLSDPNTWSLIIAARELDLHGIEGTIPEMRRQLLEQDSKGIIADELLAFGLSIYLAGFKGLLATYWVERLKEAGKLSHNDLGVFIDDVVSAIIGSVLSRIYSRLLGRVEAK